MDGMSPHDARMPSRRELMLERLGLGIIPTMLLAPAVAYAGAAPCRGNPDGAFTLVDALVVGVNGRITRNEQMVQASRPESDSPSGCEKICNEIKTL